MLPLAQSLHRWRYSTSRPALSSIWTKQHDFYDYAYKQRAETDFLLGGTAPLSNEAAVTSAALGGFNLVCADASDQAGVRTALNAALRQG